MNIIFDNKILAQYILTGADVKVVVDGDILTLADTTDVQNPRIGYGSDIHGEMYQYNYADIDYIIVNGYSIDAETFEKAAKAEKETADDTEDTNKEPEEDSNKEPEEEESEEEEEPKEESVIKPGDYVIISHPASKNFGSGGNVLISERNHITYEYYDDRQKKMSYDTVPTGWVIKNMED